ncbi:hypothetical protein DV736_g1832, partial [Chaetothyriales sp. CBS 134916]
MLLIRIMIAKVEDNDSLCATLRHTPIKQGQPGWNCVSWVKEALESLDANQTALGTRVTAWETVRNEAMAYCQRKRDQHRFDGQGDFDMSKVPTFDLIEGKETTQ